MNTTPEPAWLEYSRLFDALSAVALSPKFSMMLRAEAFALYRQALTTLSGVTSNSEFAAAMEIVGRAVREWIERVQRSAGDLEHEMDAAAEPAPPAPRTGRADNNRGQGYQQEARRGSALRGFQTARVQFEIRRVRGGHGSQSRREVRR